jgi:CP family cyanate transporter-like MFS transporter
MGAAFTARIRLIVAAAGILILAANLRASITAIGPVLTDIRAELGLSSLAASGLITIPLLAFALFSPVVPWLARRYGIERTLAVGLAALTVGIVLRSLPVPGLLWVGTALLGAAIATANVLIPALIRRDYPRDVGKLTGMYQVAQTGAAALASSLAVPIAGVLPGGWRTAIGIWAGLGLLGLVAFWPSVRQAGPVVATDLITLPGGTRPQVRSPWRSPVAWQVTAFMGAQSVFFYSALTWYPSIDVANGFSQAQAGAHQGVFQVFGVLGNVFAATVLHRLWRDQRLAVLLIAPFGIGSALGLLLVPEWSVLWNAFGGIAAGYCIVLALALITLRSSDHRETAKLSGMAQSIGYLFAATLPMVFGALHDVTGGWTVVLIGMLIALLAQSIVGLFAARPRHY